jgi:hypothetical protein
MVVTSFFLLGSAGCSDGGLQSDAMTAQLAATGIPDFSTVLAQCASLLDTNSLPMTSTITLANGGVQTTIPPQSKDTGDCKSLSFIKTDGAYDSFLFRADYAGPNINRFPNIPNQNGWDCSHSSLSYGIYDDRGSNDFVLKAFGSAFGHFDQASQTCIHDWNPQVIPGPSGTQTATLSKTKKLVIAVESWQHNDTGLFHTGTYCADSSCLWSTRITVSGKITPPPPPPPPPSGRCEKTAAGCNQAIKFNQSDTYLANWSGQMESRVWEGNPTNIPGENFTLEWSTQMSAYKIRDKGLNYIFPGNLGTNAILDANTHYCAASTAPNECYWIIVGDANFPFKLQNYRTRQCMDTSDTKYEISTTDPYVREQNCQASRDANQLLFFDVLD